MTIDIITIFKIFVPAESYDQQALNITTMAKNNATRPLFMVKTGSGKGIMVPAQTYNLKTSYWFMYMVVENRRRKAGNSIMRLKQKDADKYRSFMSNLRGVLDRFTVRVA